LSEIRLEMWPEPDLAGFEKNGQILDLPKLEPKSGATLLTKKLHDTSWSY